MSKRNLVVIPRDRLEKVLDDAVRRGRMTRDDAQQLLTEHPAEASHAFVPLTEIEIDLLDKAAEAGEIRAGLPHARVGGVMLQAIMFNAFATTIGGVPVQDGDADPADELWDLWLHGIGK